MRVLDFRAEGNRKRSVVVRRSWSLDLVPRGQPPAVPNLGNLYLSASTIVENSAGGTVVGAILGARPASTLTLIDSAGGRFAIAGANIVAAATATNFENATSHQITIRETLPGSANSPRDTVISITVTNEFEQPNLSAISLSAAVLAEGSAAGSVVGVLLGKTSGSALALVDDAGGRFAISEGNLVAGATSTDFETATSHSVTLRETLADSANSPRETVLSITIGNVFEQPSLAALTLSSSTATVGTSTSISIIGATAGSTLAGAVPDGMTLNSALRTITGTPTVAGTYDFTLTESLADSANSPRISNVTITVAASGGGAADYTATTESELTTILGLGSATLNNKRVALASGNWAQRTITLAPASKVTFVAQNPASRPNLIRWRVGAGATNLFFEDLRFVTDTWGTANGTDVFAYSGSGNVGACTWTRCGFKGGYGGPGSSGNLWENDINPTGTTRYPEYACILPVFDASGAVVNYSISRNNVAGLMADGTYPLTFSNGSGVTFSTLPTGWTMTVSGGLITGVTMGTTGASNATLLTGVGVRSNIITWPGQQRMIDYLKFGVVRDSGITVTGLQSWIDCDFADLLNGVKFIPTGGAFLEGCSFRRTYMDTIALGIAQDNATGGPVTVRFNSVSTGFSQQGDPGDPHADMMLQMFMDDNGGTQTSVDWGPITVEGNVVFDGDTRGHGQMILMADNPQNIYYKDVRIVGNIGLSRLSTVGMQSEGIRNGYIYRNTIARFIYDAADNAGTSVNCSITPPSAGWNPVGEQTFFDSNIAESFSGMDGGVTTSNGVVLGSQGASIAYATVFASPPTAAAGSGTWPTTRAGVVAAFSPTAGYVGKGAGGSDGYIDYAARTINTAMEPVFVKFTNLPNQVAGSAVSSEWRKILGGPATGTYTVSNGTVQFADDVAGTNATAATTSGSYTRGKYMRLNLTNSGSGSTATTATITFNGTWARSFASTTASAASYPVVAMDSATPDLFRRASGSLGADANVGTIALTRFKMAAPPGAVQTIFGSSSGTARVQVQLVGTTGKLRINLYNGTSQLWRIESNINVCDGVARDILVSWDTSQTTESAGRSVYIDGLPDSSSAATWGTGGQVVSYSASINAYQFGPATGNNIEIGAFYLNVAARVNLTDASNRAKFAPDLIGTNGTGPTGAQPVIFLVGNDAQWNAGLNRGSGGVHNPVGSAAVTPVSGSAWS